MSARPAAWSLRERAAELGRAEREGVDVLVVGGGITGAAVAREAALRGLRVLLVEREDFAAATSSRSSKLVHGGLRYLAQGKVALTRESCRERERLLRIAPGLVRPIPFLFPAWPDSRVPLWQIRAGLLGYDALAGFPRRARHRMLDPAATLERLPGLRGSGLHGAGLYHDAQCDDARLVLEVAKSARRAGALLANHAELCEIERDERGRVVAGSVRDRCAGQELRIRCAVLVNAAGAAVERVRGAAGTNGAHELRPAKGVHLVLPAERLPLDLAVLFDARDRRPVFLSPWQGALLLGTTDSWSDEIDEPVVTIEEVHYLLDAANRAFPRAGLTTNDLRSVFAGVRPLVAGEDETREPSAVARDHRISEGPPGLVSVFGGKLTTHHSMAERVLARVVRALPARPGRAAARSAELPLRELPGEPERLVRRLVRLGAPRRVAERLLEVHATEAEGLLARAPAAERRALGETAFCLAEVRNAFERECAASLCDVLERRLRVALLAPGQGLPQLERITAVAAEAAGWSDARAQDEAEAYAESVRRRYQISAAAAAPRVASDRARRRAAA